MMRKNPLLKACKRHWPLWVDLMLAGVIGACSGYLLALVI
jgi:hypothetical protein